MTPISPMPPYALTAPPAPETPVLRGAWVTDHVLVGAGYGGLLAAIALAERGARVMVIDAQDLGFGGSGRNHGQCIPVYRYLDPERLPPEGFELLLNSGAGVFDTIRRFDIACEAVQNGTLTAAHTPRTLETTRATHARYARWGKAGGYLDRDGVADWAGTRDYLGGWIHRDGGHLNPLAYVRGLARAAQSLGVQVHTGTPMTGLRRDNGRWIVSIPLGEISAQAVGLATDIYATAAIPATLRRTVFPLTAYGLASRPLTPEERRHVLPGGTNFGETRHDPMFFRIDTAGRIIGGGLVELRRGRNAEVTAARLTRRLSARWPVLQGLTWDHLWTGRISMAMDQMPSIQRLDDGLWGLTGWSGRGVPTSAALGQALARTMIDPADGARLWPATTPPRIFARHALGLMVQTFRGPLNQLRDRTG